MAGKYDFGHVPEARRRIMRRIRSTETQPERLVRSMLHCEGYRFRKNVSALPGKPDVVFSKRKKVIFVHGCFWHMHPGCDAAKIPKTRPEYWKPKLEATKARDQRSVERLTAEGWEVLTVWECELTTGPSLWERLRKFLGAAGANQRS